jgi:hypothetical protein
MPYLCSSTALPRFWDSGAGKLAQHFLNASLELAKNGNWEDRLWSIVSMLVGLIKASSDYRIEDNKTSIWSFYCPERFGNFAENKKGERWQ